MLITFCSSLAFLTSISVLPVFGQNVTWSSWINCTVFRTRYRNCSTIGTCGSGSSSNNDTLSFSSCPILTNEDIAKYTAQRDAATVVEKAQIENQTQQTLANLQATYETSIQTSTGFGYIAAIAIGTIISVPFLCDIHKAIVTRCGRMQLTSSKPSKKN